MNNIKKYMEILFSKDIKYIKKDYISKAITSLVFLLAAFTMLIINIIGKQELMAYCSIGLVIGFLTSFIVAYFYKNGKVSGLIIALLIELILSIFAISGGNNGFAILWILLVPIISINLIGITNGLVVSTYFLIFIFILFYSPLKSYVTDKYSIEFLTRFPVLYLADYIISTFLSLQKEYYYKINNIKSYVDELTGVYNRRYFIKNISQEIDKEIPTGIMVVDVNGLKTINDTKGHKVGDELIKAVPKCFKKVFGEDLEICRIGGDEFALVLHLDAKEVDSNINDVKLEAKKYSDKYINGLSFSVGYASNDLYDTCDMNELFSKADELMYLDKNNFYLNSKNIRRKK